MPSVTLITPSRPSARAGNAVTASRWATMLRNLGRRVSIVERYDDQTTDLVIALHAYRSADSIRRLRATRPGVPRHVPLIVVLTGTDLYRFLRTRPGATKRSIELADRLVVLNHRSARRLSPAARRKSFVILESAKPLARPRRPSRRSFDVSVVGHLRQEKDPLRAAMAARSMPETSRLRVLHYGLAHSPTWSRRAHAEMARNPRYRWFGEVPHGRVRQALGRSHLMVLSSFIEGGANVLSEAVVAGVPVLASRIDGSVGVLGADYRGYFTPGDTVALRRLLVRAETDPAFLRSLERQVRSVAAELSPRVEQRRWARLLGEMGC